MNYLIDSCLLIDAYDRKLPEAQARLKTIFAEDDNEIFINRLALLETLRGIRWVDTKKFAELKSTLEDFTVVDIDQDIYDSAISFSRFCRSQGTTLKGGCEAIDYLHFLTAKYYGFEILTSDGDMVALEKHYPAWFEKTGK
ncbi:MAG: PIN domain-containing protein [Methylococcaceae bacterium]|jgi:hypothetical protein